MDIFSLAKYRKMFGGSGGGGESGINVQSLTVTENGSYSAPSGVAYSPVRVNVPSKEPDLEEITITKNGEYTPSGDGYSKVVVNVQDKLDAFIEGTNTNVVLSTATKIKNYAFYRDTTIKKLEMPKVTTIGASAFFACTNLALTSLPSSLTGIANNAFQSCTSLALTSLPSSLTTIYSDAFRDCLGLTSITFKGKTTSIASDAFRGCTNLLTINVPWAEGAVANAPWGATNATINYNYTGD